MIFVRRNPALFPDKVLKVAERAQLELEALAPDKRAAYIKSKSHVWRAFTRYLAKMSYGKCWYSESNDPQSFFDVDHFRPKNEAVRADGLKDDGYQWLAFSWDNYRFSAGRSNRKSKDEETDETVGKGSWFPLLDGSQKATWDNRNVTEYPVLLDPLVRDDVDLIDVDENGYMCPSDVCVGSSIWRVERSAELYGLNLPGIHGARTRAMREIKDLYLSLIDMIETAKLHKVAADSLPIIRQKNQIRRSTLPNSPFSKAARAQLIFLGAAFLCAQPEDIP